MNSDDDYYSDNDYDGSVGSDDESGSEDDYGFDLTTVEEDGTRRPPYTVLSEEDILSEQREAIDGVVSVLSVDTSTATTLLRFFKWSVSRLHDDWFQDEARVRAKVGLPPSSSNEGVAKASTTCQICFDEYAPDKLRSASCGHFFCQECWQGYLKTGINDGPGCLSMRCPLPDCNSLVPETLIEELVEADELAKYKRFHLRSYVEDNHKVKWCPAPGCCFAVELKSAVPAANEPLDIGCKCGTSFCWSCDQEAHRPVDCETVKKWVLKNSAESENMNWILANSKPCPKCKRPIEKNQGCMHMTCTPPCRFEFCWLCLAPWSEHGERTGGFYSCNRYDANKNAGEYDETEKRRENARNSLERYMHYYERWAAHEKARVKAQEDLKEMSDDKLKRLSECQSTPVSQLKFVTDAWTQIVECRRVIKWTYGYGFYAELSQDRRNFFEFMQGEAELSLDNLHRAAELELAPFLSLDTTPTSSPVPAGLAASPSTASYATSPAGSVSSLYGTTAAFDDFRSKLTGLTAITKHFFDTLVCQLEKGLDSSDNTQVIEAMVRSKTSEKWKI
ncbi:hypothetical protein CYMTET_13334 [Cymbomonas tetramitiformis]|uniref:RBR-type E3 ubiquitin transferase n=1 Tax=Cymbomonas tetramitiformis TaxID=36881 RepID=A0AAE0GIM0_9CHLO|nr:hypothetical protein CYMTET_13334 [Cymbomonas tetramitiformis]